MRTVELLYRRKATPGVRTADMQHGSTLSCGLVKRDPAADLVAGIQPRQIAAVLVEPERLRGARLPNQIVHAEACPGPATKLCASPTDVLSKGDARYSMI